MFLDAFLEVFILACLHRKDKTCVMVPFFLMCFLAAILNFNMAAILNCVFPFDYPRY